MVGGMGEVRAWRFAFIEKDGEIEVEGKGRFATVEK